MGLRRYKPTTPGRRGASVSDFAELTPGYQPEKGLLRPIGQDRGPHGTRARLRRGIVVAVTSSNIG